MVTRWSILPATAVVQRPSGGTCDDVTALGDLLTPVRDHMRATPPRSAKPRRRKKAD